MAMPRWRVKELNEGVFEIQRSTTDDQFRPATIHEVETGLSQLHLFGAEDGRPTSHPPWAKYEPEPEKR